MKSLLVGVRAVLFASGFVYLWAWVALAVETLDGRIQARLPEWMAVLGLTVMAAGAALALSCIAIFVTVGRGTPAPFDAPRRFVAVGPYRYVRNPMYVGGFLVLAGWALYRQSPSVLLFAAAWLGLAHLFVLGYEEPTLRGKFGADYERYLETVPRWIPFRRGRSEGRKRQTSQVRPPVVVLEISLGGIPSTAADRPDLTGGWKMNRARSEFGPLPGTESRTHGVDHREPRLKLTRTQWTAAAKAAPSEPAPTDGAECSTAIRGNPLRSTARWDGEGPRGETDQTILLERQGAGAAAQRRCTRR